MQDSVLISSSDVLLVNQNFGHCLTFVDQTGHFQILLDKTIGQNWTLSKNVQQKTRGFEQWISYVDLVVSSDQFVIN